MTSTVSNRQFRLCGYNVQKCGKSPQNWSDVMLCI